jgi:hypothetical protein
MDSNSMLATANVEVAHWLAEVANEHSMAYQVQARRTVKRAAAFAAGYGAQRWRRRWSRSRRPAGTASSSKSSPISRKQHRLAYPLALYEQLLTHIGQGGGMNLPYERIHCLCDTLNLPFVATGYRVTT